MTWTHHGIVRIDNSVSHGWNRSTKDSGYNSNTIRNSKVYSISYKEVCVQDKGIVDFDKIDCCAERSLENNYIFILKLKLKVAYET